MPAALIWGASGGIGRALVIELKQAGWQVFAAARHESAVPSEADAVCYFDAANSFTIEQAAVTVAQQADALDLVVYAAGGLSANLLEKLTPEEWNATLHANLTGAFLAARTSLNLLKRDGHLMLIGAYTEKITLPRMGAYVAAKAGLESLVTVLQKENRKLKITLVRPPAVDTPFWHNVPFNLPASALQPQQVASAMVEHYVKGEAGELNL